MARTKSKLVVVREPNGRMSRSVAKELDAISPTEVRRLVDAALCGLRDQQWGTELGRLFLLKKIDVTQYEAGKRWARLVACFHKATAAPPPNPKAHTFASGGRSHEPDPDSEEGQKIAELDVEIIASMREAHAVLIGAGKLAENAVRMICELDQVPYGALMMNALRTGLDWLALHWGLTTQPSNVRRGT